MKNKLFLIYGFIPIFFTAKANISSSNLQKKEKHIYPAPCARPVVTISGDTTICEGDTATITATGGGTYLWNTGQTTSTIKVVPLNNTTYTVEVTVDTCSAGAVTTVNVVPGPYGSYIIPTTATICGGSNGVNFALGCCPGPYSCTWVPSTYLTCSTCFNPTANPPSSVTYTVTIFDEETGCSVSITIPVIVSDSLTAAISGADSICIGNSTTLIASGGSTYLWNNGDTSNVISVNPAVTTTYSVRVASGSCTDSATFTVKVDSCAVSGINSIQKEKTSVVLFPDPGKGIFTIADKGEEPVAKSIDIFNVFGEKVYSQCYLPGSIFNIDLLFEPSGIYFYRVTAQSGELIGKGKFIIQK